MRSSWSRLCATAAAVALVLAAPASQAASSTFGSDAEGWQLVDVPGGGNYTDVQAGFPSPVTYTGTGGNPGGFISATDPSTLTFFFAAPTAFLGNQSAAYGGSLKYDIKVTAAAGDPWTSDPDVVLISAAGVLVYDFGTSAANNPGTSFTSRTIAWTEFGWRVGSIAGAAVTQQQFQQVTSNLTGLLIAGEFIASTAGAASFETASLDNVLLAPVPEPSEALLMSLGLAGVLLARRRTLRVDAARRSGLLTRDHS